MRTMRVLRGAPGSGKITQSRQHGLADGSSPLARGRLFASGMVVSSGIIGIEAGFPPGPALK